MKSVLFLMSIVLLSCNSTNSKSINIDSTLKQYRSPQNDSLYQKLIADKLYRYSYYINILLKDSGMKAATGFIIEYKTQYYLVTNFHVLLNVSPDLIEEQIPDTDTLPVRIAIFYMNEKETEIKPDFFDLYDKKTRRATFSLLFDDTNKHYYDIAILPIPKPPTPYFITIKNVDTQVVKSGEKILIIGYPEGKIEKDKYLPEAFVAYSVKRTNEINICYDKVLPHGTSGSPIFLYEPYKEFKVIGIASNSDSTQIDFQGFGFNIKYLPIMLNMFYGN